jgi:hypothetical protein
MTTASSGKMQNHKISMSHKIREGRVSKAGLTAAVVVSVLCALTPSLVLADAPSVAAMTQVLRNAKVVNTDRALHLSIGNKRVLIITERGAKSTDKDCRIDAVLLAKTLIDTYSSEIISVKVLFSKADSDKLTQVNVTTGDVKAFGSGQISEDDLLSSLDVQEVSAESAGPGDTSANTTPDLVPGPFLEKRLILMQQIDSMEKKGTGVKPFRDLFNKIEADVKNGDQTSAMSDIQYLSEKLGEQQKVLKDLSSPRRPTGAIGASGGRTDIGEASQGSGMGRSAMLLKRCDEWDQKLRGWKSQGRDVLQLIYSMAVIRGFCGDPNKYEMAKSMLDAMDATVVAPPRAASN